jgi:hypothetical protein
MGRKRFLRLGAGVAMAVGLTVAGRIPAFAQSEQVRARAWDTANKGRLPQHYQEVITRPLEYRRAIFGESSPQVPSRLWLAHLDQYRATYPVLSEGRVQVLDQAAKILGDVSVFEQSPPQPDIHHRLEDLRKAAVDAFGEQEARALIATLGPVENPSMATALDDCSCSTSNDLCGSPPLCVSYECNIYRGCGVLWLYLCNGFCVY